MNYSDLTKDQIVAMFTAMQLLVADFSSASDVQMQTGLSDADSDQVAKQFALIRSVKFD